jgi:hypothetical protein
VQPAPAECKIFEAEKICLLARLRGGSFLKARSHRLTVV